MIWSCLKFEELFAAPLRNGVYKPKQFHGRGQKMVNMGELFAYDFLSNQEMRRIELSDTEKKNSLLRAGDLLFARRSLVLEGSGKCSLVTGTEEDTTFESSIIRARLNQAKAHPKFYFYFFGSPQGRALMASIASQTAVSGITGSNLALLKVPHPSLSSQVKIATILSAYDDLIENNTRRIRILEEMARRIYEEWFVHFRFPGHENVRMVESTFGLIPAGWNTTTLKDTCSFIGRGISPKYTDVSEQFVINQKCIRDEKLNLGLARRHSCNVPSDKVVRFGDVLINSTGVGTLGRVAQVYTDVRNYTVDTHVTIVRPKSEIDRDYFGLSLLKLQPHFDRLGFGATGQTELSRTSVANTKILLPLTNVQDLFSKTVSPMRKNAILLNQKNENLRRTRDLLLPKLLSGEIDVSNFPEPITD